MTKKEIYFRAFNKISAFSAELLQLALDMEEQYIDCSEEDDHKVYDSLTEVMWKRYEDIVIRIDQFQTQF